MGTDVRLYTKLPQDNGLLENYFALLRRFQDENKFTVWGISCYHRSRHKDFLKYRKDGCEGLDFKKSEFKDANLDLDSVYNELVPIVNETGFDNLIFFADVAITRLDIGAYFGYEGTIIPEKIDERLIPTSVRLKGRNTTWCPDLYTRDLNLVWTLLESDSYYLLMIERNGLDFLRPFWRQNVNTAIENVKTLVAYCSPPELWASEQGCDFTNSEKLYRTAFLVYKTKLQDFLQDVDLVGGHIEEAELVEIAKKGNCECLKWELGYIIYHCRFIHGSLEGFYIFLKEFARSHGDFSESSPQP